MPHREAIWLDKICPPDQREYSTREVVGTTPAGNEIALKMTYEKKYIPDAVGFRIWYQRGEKEYYSVDSGGIPRDLEIDWKACPNDKVLAVVIFHEMGYRTIMKGGDWYYLWGYAPSRHWDKDVDRPDEAIHPRKMVKHCGKLPDAHYANLLQRLKDDRSWSYLNSDTQTTVEWKRYKNRNKT